MYKEVCAYARVKLVSGLGVLVSTCQFTTLCVQLVSDLIDTISLIPMSRGSYGHSRE